MSSPDDAWSRLGHPTVTIMGRSSHGLLGSISHGLVNRRDCEHPLVPLIAAQSQSDDLAWVVVVRSTEVKDGCSHAEEETLGRPSVPQALHRGAAVRGRGDRPEDDPGRRGEQEEPVGGGSGPGVARKIRVATRSGEPEHQTISTQPTP